MRLLQTLSILDYFVLVLIFLGLIALFICFNKSRSATNYLMLGRTLSLPMFVATLVSSWYGGIFAVTEISFKHGVYNFITQGIFWYLSALCFALFVVKRACTHQVFSLIEIIEKNYDRKTARMLAVLLFAKTLPITYAISIGLFINLMFNLSLEFGIFIGCMVVMFYSLNGSFKKVLQIDIAQFFLMLTAVIPREIYH